MIRIPHFHDDSPAVKRKGFFAESVEMLIGSAVFFAINAAAAPTGASPLRVAAQTSERTIEEHQSEGIAVHADSECFGLERPFVIIGSDGEVRDPRRCLHDSPRLVFSRFRFRYTYSHYLR